MFGNHGQRPRDTIALSTASERSDQFSAMASSDHGNAGGWQDPVRSLPSEATVSRLSVSVIRSRTPQRRAGRETGGADAAFPALTLAGGDLPLRAGGEELLARPGFAAARSARRGTDSRNANA